MSTDRDIEPTASAESTESKRRYRGPSLVVVGSVETVTKGHGTPVADMPPGTEYGYYDASKTLDDDAEVDLQGR